MPLTIGTDSYVTAAQLQVRAVAKGWVALAAESEATQEELLKDAFLYLNVSYDWKGVITDLAQEGAWPRTGVYDHEGRALDSAAVPTAVETAQMEIAFLQYTQGAILTGQTQGQIESVKAGSVAVKFTDGNTPNEGQKIPHITRLLAGLYESAPGQIAANVSLLKA